MSHPNKTKGPDLNEMTRLDAEITKHEGIARAVAAKCRTRMWSADDLYPVALEGVWEAVVSYNPDRGWKKEYYIWHRCSHRTVDFLRTHSKIKDAFTHSVKPGSEAFNDMSAANETTDERDEVNVRMRGLDAREKAIIKMQLNGLTNREIASALGHHAVWITYLIRGRTGPRPITGIYEKMRNAA